MFGKFHTPLQKGGARVIISYQKIINKLFLKKNRLSKTALAAEPANFFRLVFGSGHMKGQIIILG